MGEDIELERGIIDAMSRVLTELIDTPLVKSIVRLTVNDIDPKSASKLLKALVWGDIEFLVNILGFIPPLVNTVAEILNDLPDELQHFSPKMIDGLVSQVIGDIEIKRLAEGVNGLVQYLSSLIEDDPKFVSDLVSNLLSDLLSALDDRALGRMMGNLLGAVVPVILNPKLINILLKDIPNLLGGLFEGLKIGDLLSSVIGTIFPTVKRLLGPLLDILGPLIKAMLKMLTPLFRNIGPLLGAVGPVLKSLVQGIGPLLEALAKGVVSLFGSST